MKRRLGTLHVVMNRLYPPLLLHGEPFQAPVGEIKGGGEGERGGKEAEAAALKIQRWYRRNVCEKDQTRAAEVENLLRGKKAELDRSRSEQQQQLLLIGHESSEREREEQRRRREEKMRASRQAAILGPAAAERGEEERGRESCSARDCEFSHT